ncbi:hypothetical protein OC846_002878 [Tilletia horrida]|uniref:Transmembrane protein n=1 Tax=Tilletia horrida TaxID=155126 RepID=A0AAN6GQN7_9BASI|nr:hypothetical protein OC845_002073 [Tilletia horrida]KAK0552474.1 hypothetical protein OC846_002878 [Tilletia horrida]KAK0570156.1 hypothetical protein OC861_000105 [Tilletia horrida]
MRVPRIFTSSAALAAASISLTILGLAVSQTQAAKSNPIPSNAEPQCQDFLTKLNSDPGLSACITPLSNATELYQTGLNTGNVTSTLNQLCGSGGTVANCNEQSIRQNLTDFWTACKNDIVNQTFGVYNVYDFLYVLIPFKNTICQTDSGGAFCLLNVAKAAAQTPPASSAAAASAEGSTISGEADGLDNSTSTSNVAFLFVEPNASSDLLCSECTQSILANYIKFELSQPYAVGLASSNFLSGQSALYSAAEKTCKASFVKQVNVLAVGNDDWQTVGAATPGSTALSSSALLGVALVMGGMTTLML